MVRLREDSGSGGGREIIPEGTYAAVCYQVIDLGHQDVEYQGKKKVQHKVWISWEIPDAPRVKWEKDGKSYDMPARISNEYSLSFSEKANLRKLLEAWRGKRFEPQDMPFDIEKLIGAPCFMQITHNTKGSKTYDNIGSVMTLPKGMDVPQMENEPLIFNIYDEDGEVISPFPNTDVLPDWMVEKKIHQCHEYQDQVTPDQRVSHVPEPSGNVGFDEGDEPPF